MAAKDNIYLLNDDVLVFEKWVKTTSRKFKKRLLKWSYVYYGAQGDLHAKIYIGSRSKLLKRLSKCNLEMLRNLANED